MRIGHYVPGTSHRGGVTTYVSRLGEGQRAAGHQVVFFDDESHRRPAQSSVESVVFVRDQEDLLITATRMKVDVLHLHSGLFASPTAHIPVIRTVHGHQPYCPSGSRFLARQGLPCGRNYHVAGCLWGHVVDRCGSMRPQNMLRNFKSTREEMRHSRRYPIAAVSRFVRDQLLRSGYPKELLHVLYLPSPDLSELTQPPCDGSPRFVFLGRLTPVKGLSWLIRSFALLGRQAHLDIAGEGPQSRRIVSL